MTRLVIGTRGSPLARWQANHVASEIGKLGLPVKVEIRVIVTEGDRTPAGALVDAGGKGLWVQDIERALLAGTVDLAVHSLKDVPAELAGGLALAAVPPRADPRDALVTRSGGGWDALAPGARLGTASLRRVCQVRALRPDLGLQLLRGNVDTRLRKVAEGAVDGALLACAGLDRLGFSARIAERIPVETVVPAIGQGALAIEARAGDPVVLPICERLSDPRAETAVAAERALLGALGVGCRTPVAGHAVLSEDGTRLTLSALVGRPDASEIIRESIEGAAADAILLGREAAERLLSRGAGRILAELER